MQTSSLLYRLVRYTPKYTELKSTRLPGGALPDTPFDEETMRILVRLDRMSCTRAPLLTAASLKSSLELAQERRDLKVNDDNVNSEAEAKAKAKLRELEFENLLEEVNDDTVNSEAKLHAMFLKWLSFNDHHFCVEDEKAFRERFENFKYTARFINQHNKSGSSFTCGLNLFSDLTRQEFATCSWKIYPKKPNQVIAGIAEYLDNKVN